VKACQCVGQPVLSINEIENGEQVIGGGEKVPSHLRMVRVNATAAKDRPLSDRNEHNLIFDVNRFVALSDEEDVINDAANADVFQESQYTRHVLP